MFEQFPYTNFHELNLDWIIDQLRRTMESAVLSVNGQTGDVVLYQSENVVFPDVDSAQWRMVRTAAGHIAGVMFQNGLMYVMYDGTADRVYTINNPPPYPVSSVMARRERSRSSRMLQPDCRMCRTITQTSAGRSKPMVRRTLSVLN